MQRQTLVLGVPLPVHESSYSTRSLALVPEAKAWGMTMTDASEMMEDSVDTTGNVPVKTGNELVWLDARYHVRLVSEDRKSTRLNSSHII